MNFYWNLFILDTEQTLFYFYTNTIVLGLYFRKYVYIFSYKNIIFLTYFFSFEFVIWQSVVLVPYQSQSLKRGPGYWKPDSFGSVKYSFMFISSKSCSSSGKHDPDQLLTLILDLSSCVHPWLPHAKGPTGKGRCAGLSSSSPATSGPAIWQVGWPYSVQMMLVWHLQLWKEKYMLLR